MGACHSQVAIDCIVKSCQNSECSIFAHVYTPRYKYRGGILFRNSEGFRLLREYFVHFNYDIIMKLLVSIFVVGLAVQVMGHGRIVTPCQRGSLWRFPEYAWANPGHVADDQELLCGGTSVSNSP